MKKTLLLGLLLLVIVGCGNPMKGLLYTNEEKVEIINAMVDDEDPEATKKYDEIVAELQKLVKDGNMDAKAELASWTSKKRTATFFRRKK